MVDVIGEVGSNHCASLQHARQLIEIAAEAGVDCVKFQWIDRERIWESPGDRGKWTEVDLRFLEECKIHADSFGLEFACTPFAPWQIPKLNPLVKRWKIAAAHVRDHELLQPVFETGKPIMVSVSCVEPEKVWEIGKWALPLHCVSRYPAMPRDYGLTEWLRRATPTEWGISDHSVGIGTAIAAVTMGASVVEKHIALENQPPSPDDGIHALRPDALRAMVAGIRQAESAVEGVIGPNEFPAGRKVWV